MRSLLCLLDKYVRIFPRCVSTVSQIPTKCFAGCHHRSHQWRITDVDQHRALFTRLGSGQNKIKRVDRLLGNESLHRDIPLIFNNIIAMLTSQLSLCVIAVDWSGYSSQEHHVLRASLLCDGCSLPLLSWVVPSEKQQNSQIQKLPRCPCRGCKPCGQSHNSYRCGCSYPLFPDRAVS